jgi:hypothetical protein
MSTRKTLLKPKYTVAQLAISIIPCTVDVVIMYVQDEESIVGASVYRNAGGREGHSQSESLAPERPYFQTVGRKFSG